MSPLYTPKALRKAADNAKNKRVKAYFERLYDHAIREQQRTTNGGRKA